MTDAIDISRLPSKKDVLREMQRRMLCSSHLYFTTEMFRAKELMDFIVADFHRVVCDTLDRVFLGEIPRLIINIPPGFGKTELAVINFIARGFAINPRARFIHVSYSQPLALDNSSKVKDIVGLPEYQDIFPVQFRKDTTGKALWRTAEGGHLRAASSFEPITGFRAGYMDPGKFTGAMVIDDPLKPSDALSDAERKKVNRNYMNTLRSRLAHENVPVIVIMQRLHIDDYTAHLLNGGSGEMWHYLNIPVEVTNDRKKREWSHGVEIPYDLPEGPTWPFKFDHGDIKKLEADEYMTQSQYFGDPVPLGGALFKSDMFEEFSWDDLPNFRHRFMVADTAMNDKTHNDFTAVGLFGWGKDNRLYMLDLLHVKMQIPDMEIAVEEFYKKHRDLDKLKLVQMRAIRKFMIENKSSGVGLIQRLVRKGIPVVKIERDRDKTMRALDCLPYIKVKPVLIPRDAPWKTTMLSEMLAFGPTGTLNDDIVDVVMDAITDTMITGVSLSDVL